MNRVALYIGNTEYINTTTFPNLFASVNDARDMAQTFEEYGNFQTQSILINESSETIKSEIDSFFSTAKRGMLLLLYFSGHGYRDKFGDLHFAVKNTNEQSFLSTAVSASFIQQAIRYSQAKHVVIILDCCFSGAFAKGSKSGEIPISFEPLKGETIALLASSGAIQLSFEESGRNSLFTSFLLQGIRNGYAADSDGNVTIEGLFDYVDQSVRTERPEQTPIFEGKLRGDKIILAKSTQIAEASSKTQVSKYYTEDALDIGMIALSIAIGCNHKDVFPEHILLALLIPVQSIVPSLLTSLGTNAAEFFDDLVDILHHKMDDIPIMQKGGKKISYSKRVATIMSLAKREAENMNAVLISGEHIFLAMFLERDTLTARLLSNHDLTYANVREALTKSLA